MRVFPGTLQAYYLCAAHKYVKKNVALQHYLDNSHRLITVPKACLALITDGALRRLRPEPMLWLKKGFGFAGEWTVRRQNELLACCFGLQMVNMVNKA